MIGLPRRFGFYDRVKPHQQLAHAGHQGDFLGLAPLQEPLVELAKPLVVAYRRQCGHVEGRPYRGASAPSPEASTWRQRISARQDAFAI